MNYLKDREIWLSNVPTGNPPAGFFWKFIQNGKVVVRDSNGNNQMMIATNGNQAITGSLIVTGGITGTVSSASYVEYSNVANKPTLVSGSEQVTYSGLTGVPVGIVSGSAQVAGFGIFATTGSNGFNGNQAITGSLTVTGAIVAQTLNVQQVTSSVVFSSGSNVFGNSLGNTQQFTGSLQVTGSSHYLLGNVGVGTANPTAISSFTTLEIRGATGGGIKIGKTAFAQLNIQQDGTDAYLNNTANGALYFYTNDTPRLTITSTGSATFSSSVTSLAASPLVASVSSNSSNDAIVAARWTSGIGMEMRYNPNSAVGFIQNTYPVEINQLYGDIQFRHSVSDTMTPRMIIKGYSGNVGIGTSSPGQLLDIVGTTPIINIQAGANNNARGIQFNYNGAFVIGSFLSFGGTGENALSAGATGTTGYFLTLKTDGTERVRITNDNNVLFNTTSTSTSNTSSFIFRSGTGAYSGVMVMNHATTNNTGAGFIDCFYNTGYIGGIQQNGASNVSFSTSSDYRLKEDLKDFNGLNLISNLKVYDFKWKTEDSRMYGLMAHELQEVIPYTVSGNKDEIKENGKIKVQVVDYSKLIPVLVKAIQELKAENDTLKSRIEILEQ